MNILGIIAEFNPFHNGHAYLINEAKRLTNADYCIIVMSGNFVQRGEPSLMSKYTRAKIALDNGADIVLELPVLASTASAEGFAYGAVSLLNSLGVVTHLAFGSEFTDISLLNDISDILINEPNEFKVKIKELCGKQMSYPAARAKALAKLMPGDKKNYIIRILNSPNSILAVEYLKSLKRLSSNIIPVPIKRIGSGYNDSKSYENLSSASGIRNFLKEKKDISLCVPSDAGKIMSDYEIHRGFIYEEDVFPNLLCKVLLLSSEELANYADSNEFLGNRIKRNCHEFSSYKKMLDILSSKDYTMSRIKRVLTHILLDIDTTYTPMESYNDYKSLYARILACKNGNLLSDISKKSNIPVVFKPSKQIESLDVSARKLLDLDLKATIIYEAITASKHNHNPENELTKNIFPEKKR